MSIDRTGGGVSPSLSIDLFSPGMTALHRTGLAGLAMTLLALESDPGARDLRTRGSWVVGDRTVSIEWQGDGNAFFTSLLEQSFRVTGTGLIWFPALGDPLRRPGESVILHNALLGTFLQHPQSRRSASKTTISLVVDVDGNPMRLSFLPLSGYAHQRAPFDGSKALRVAGWMYPGGVVRHWRAESETAISEDPARALALLYAPIGAIFFQVHRQTAGVRPQYCLVLPDIRDLLGYQDARQLFFQLGVSKLQVAGPADAAARVLAELRAGSVLRGVGVGRCTVTAFGSPPWSERQKTRIEQFAVNDVRPSNLVPYQIATRALPPKIVTTKPDPKTGEVRQWWVVPQVPDLVAENVLEGEPWWRGFADLWSRAREAAPRKQRAWALYNERRGLQVMVDDSRVLANGAEVSLVRACQEAWRRRLGEIGERSRQQGLDFGALARREYDRRRISFARCKNAAMFRQSLTDFWSRAGSLPELQDTWPLVLPYLQDRWRDGRDLALLALASYKPRSSEEVNALTTGVRETAEGESA